jgi:PGF-pre-PGF domain-containing protein
MKIKLIQIFYGLFLFISILTPVLAVPGDWWGIVQIDGINATKDTIVTAHLNNSSAVAATAYVGAVTEWYYLIHVEGNTSDNVTFKVCGVDAYPTNETPQPWSEGDHPQLNLSITTLADGNNCTYACGCSGGYCVHGYCRSSPTYCGDNHCDSGEDCSSCSSDCGECPTTPTYYGGGGGPTVLPTVEETKTITLIVGGTTVTFTFTKSDDLKIQQIELRVNANLTNVGITIKESSKPTEAPEPVPTTGKVYKYVEISKTNIYDENISEAKIKFKVEKSWLTNNSIDSSKVSLKRWYNNRWEELSTNKISEDAVYAYYEARSTGLSVFAITGIVELEVVKEPCPYECCVGEANYIDKLCPPEHECRDHRCIPLEIPKRCPICPEPTDWSECMEGKQTRTKYVCNETTNYNCKIFLETQECEEVEKITWVTIFYKYWWVWVAIGIILFCILWPWEPLIRI